MAKQHHYGTSSEHKLLTCHPDMQRVLRIGLRRSPYDIIIVHGWRGETVQNALFDSGASRKRWPESRHNASEDGSLSMDVRTVSDAVDFAPYVNGRIPWDDTHIFAVIAGVLMAVANEQEIPVRWGGDWDADGLTSDQTLMDWGHIERIQVR